MWSKLSNVLKPRVAHEDPELSSQADVMAKVYEQHPNLSVFHNDSEHMTSPSPPPSPSKSAKRNMFKRMSKVPFKDDNEPMRAPSPMIGQPKKVKSPFNLGNGNNSQASLSKLPTETKRPSPARRSSFDMLRPANESSSRSAATIGAGTTLRRPSLDMLRFTQDAPPTNEPSPMTPSADIKCGSVRSILRDPKTPGTGQNVRFFSRDAYKVISPDQSMDAEFQPIMQENESPAQNTSPEILLDRLSRIGSEGPGTPAVTRASSSAKAPRPSVTEVFSPMNSVDNPPPPKEQATFLNSTNLLSPIPPPDFADLFDMSHKLDLPKMPPGLGFEIEEPSLHNMTDMSMTDDGHGEPGARPAPMSAMTSTPFKDKGKCKAKDIPLDVSAEKENMPIDETIFHAKEKSPRLPPALHDRSQSFSFGQTVFHSMINASGSAKSSPNSSAVFSSSDLKPSLLDNYTTDSPARAASPVFTKYRSRALSDTVFQSMMRSPPRPPEADINDESSQELVVYSGTPEQPDPFRANATTYYTPQTMIPVTPPQGAPKHVRKTSKEESIIFSLQTQLALQTELCGQYETDLRARDELVEILGKKLGDVEKEEGKRRSLLRSWKKKVQELEKACRYLEEEVEGSRQNSMERSIMDEASGEALRMLHRQIAVLEREKAEWGRKEEILRDEVATLEGLVKERSEDVMQLKETLWKRDESERELSQGILEAKEQIEQMGNVSCGLIDEEEMKKLVLEKEMRSEQERERHRVAEFGWEEERAEMMSKVQDLEADKTTLEAELENFKLQLNTRDEEYGVLKAELSAQWEHTEKASEKIEALEAQVLDLEKERDTLKADMEELQQKMANMDTEWNESENKKAELENEVQEVWNIKEDLEKEREQLEDQLQQERDHSEDLTRALQEREDRISELDQERQFAQENLARLEEKLRQRDQEISEHTERMVVREAEAERLREEMSNQRREHTHDVAEQTRALEEASLREGEARAQMEALVRQQAALDIEMKSSADKVNALKEEVERLRRKIQVLQQESADKEVKLLQLNKQHQRDKEDLEGINTALDSKQMELELIKRNLGVRGTGGATPAPASRVAQHRRDSTIFSTPTVSRPSSVASNASSTIGKDRKRISAETPASSATKISALGKSIRANGISTTASASKRIEGSMGPPPLKARASLAGGATPTPAPRVSSLSRSSSAKPGSVQPAVSVHRRVSSLEQSQSQAKTKPLRQVVNPSPIPSLSEHEEKENVDVSSRRKNMIPTPA
ncbi:hypothetical protein D9615_007716 [Tricholomella constricta]|uniref:Uncharacterized protein n=1 Tax=Tricholomella constricta TaxID=117010 RepID=A0A8H5H453_9AGAR|nr:hypothetical protein D9615_007716 [Tricholomella constricta]